MRVHVVGSGGREQAIAWACGRHGHDVSVSAELRSFDASQLDLVIVGPEAALVAGVADECHRLGIPCFGPTAELARLEGSKAHARSFADALGIPSPAFATFDDAAAATAWWEQFGRPVVVKQSGLAGGKGVIVPDDDAGTRQAIAELAGRGPIVLEERLEGPECSLIALCDGTTAVALPLAQDHKRIGEGDTGPNTGGMGAFAPAPVPYAVEELTATFVQPVVDALRAAATTVHDAASRNVTVCSPSRPRVQARASSARSFSSSGSSACASGSPNRQFHSSSFGPSAVSMRPAKSTPTYGVPAARRASTTGWTNVAVSSSTAYGTGAGANAPMPPVFGPVSPSPMRLWSWASRR